MATKLLSICFFLTLSFNILVASLRNSGEILEVWNNLFSFMPNKSRTFAVLAREEQDGTAQLGRQKHRLEKKQNKTKKHRLAVKGMLSIPSSAPFLLGNLGPVIQPLCA